MKILYNVLALLAFSSIFTTAVTAATPPVSVNAVSTGAGVTISWTASSDPSAVDYRVYRDDVEIVHGVNGLSYTDVGVQNGVSYKYFVIACDASLRCGIPSSPHQTIQFNGGAITVIAGGNSGGDPEQCSVASSSTLNTVPTDVALVNLDGVLSLTWVPPANSVRWNVYRNDQYEFTISNGVPAYTVENHLDTNSYYVTAIFPDGSISSQSADAVSGATESDNSEAALQLAELEQINADLAEALELLQLDFDALQTLQDNTTVELTGAVAELGSVTTMLGDVEAANETLVLNLELTQGDLEACQANL